MLEGMTTAANGRKRRAGGRKGTRKEGRKRCGARGVIRLIENASAAATVLRRPAAVGVSGDVDAELVMLGANKITTFVRPFVRRRLGRRALAATISFL